MKPANKPPYRCVNCGKGFSQTQGNWYAECDCKGAWCMDEQGKALSSAPLCAWCGDKPVAYNIDGDYLCLPCANKWARAEGLANQENNDARFGFY